MKKEFTILFVFLVLSILVGPAGAAEQVVIIVNPGSFASIEEAADSEESIDWWDDDLTDDRACTESYGATELAKFLPKCTNLKESDIVLSFPDKMPATGDVILVGSGYSNPFITSMDLSGCEQLETEQSFRLFVVKKGNRRITVIEGKDRIGTLYGVYGYLRRLGLKFYGLGEKGTVYPKKPAELPSSLNVVENPSFFTRGYHAWQNRGNKKFLTWMARNRMNVWTIVQKEHHLLKKLGIKLACGTHDTQARFIDPNAEYPYNHPKFAGDEDKPDDPYAVGTEYTGQTSDDGKLTNFGAHPDWYALIDGKRIVDFIHWKGTNYCTSNEDATAELTRNLIQCLIDGDWKHADMLNVVMVDGGRWCECENCKKQGSYTDRYFNLLHRISKKIKEAQLHGRLKRKINLIVAAYLETMEPPTRPLPDDFDYKMCAVRICPIMRCYAHALNDPKCTEYNLDKCNKYMGWSIGSDRFYKGMNMIVEYYNVSRFKTLPVLHTRIMREDIPFYYETGTRYFQFMHCPTDHWGTWTLNLHLLSQLLWDVNCDSGKVLDDYFTEYFPTTSKHTRSFYEHLENAFRNIHVLKWRSNYTLSEQSLKDGDALFPNEHFQYEASHPEKNDALDLVEIVKEIQLAREQIDAAMLKCSDDVEQKRLLEDERRFFYGESMVNFFYHMYRTAMFHKRNKEALARREFIYVEQMAQRLRTVTDFVHVASSDSSAKDGFEATMVIKGYEFLKEKYGK